MCRGALHAPHDLDLHRDTCHTNGARVRYPSLTPPRPRPCTTLHTHTCCHARYPGLGHLGVCPRQLITQPRRSELSTHSMTCRAQPMYLRLCLCVFPYASPWGPSEPSSTLYLGSNVASVSSAPKLYWALSHAHCQFSLYAAIQATSLPSRLESAILTPHMGSSRCLRSGPHLLQLLCFIYCSSPSSSTAHHLLLLLLLLSTTPSLQGPRNSPRHQTH